VLARRLGDRGLDGLRRDGAPGAVAASARPAERSTERRVSPVPAGTGMPGSTTGRPEPARATDARKRCERVKSSQQSAI